MFATDFPRDGEVSYSSTENIDGQLKKTVADIIITIRAGNRLRRFHMEGQINNDSTIVVRVFEYGFHDALRNRIAEGHRVTLPFPAPIIIFLEHTESTPDSVILELDFGEYGKIDYPVPTVKFLAYDVADLRQKKMTILLPFYLLKMRREVENARMKHGRDAALRQCAKRLKELIEKDLLPTIAASERAGDLTHSDAFELLKLLSHLYDYLYGGIEEFKDEEVKSMIVDDLVLEYDIELAEAKAAAKAEAMAEAAAAAAARLRDEKITAARNFKRDGFPVDSIARNLGLLVAEVETA